jgi:hypothetical protein
MATVVKPKSMSVERWCIMRRGAEDTTHDIVIFSGYAWFAEQTLPVNDLDWENGWHSDIRGEGENDDNLQKAWYQFNVTDMIVGPRWRSLEGVSPSVVIAGHDQSSPDEADGMGAVTMGINQINIVAVGGGFKRIELQVSVAVRGGWRGQIPCLAYHATAFGMLAPKPGSEGTQITPG